MDKVKLKFFTHSDKVQYIGLPDNSIVKYIKCLEYEYFPINIKINGLPVPITNIINKCYIEASGDVVVGSDLPRGFITIELIYFFPG